MSLIDDALRRAQEEAARQDEAHRLARRPWIAPQPPRRRGRAGRFAAIGIAFALAAGSVWFLARRAAPVPPRALSPAPRPAHGPAAAPGPSVVPAEPAKPALENVEVAPPVAARPAPERPKTNRAVPEGDPVSKRSPGEQPAPPPAPARPPRPSPIPDGKTFVRTVNLPGEEAIELDGIVFSETSPVAVIGGHLLGPGSWVGDFEIVKIEENRVTLRGRGVTIFLTPS
jgi:hypothetical protein